MGGTYTHIAVAAWLQNRSSTGSTMRGARWGSYSNGLPTTGYNVDLLPNGALYLFRILEGNSSLHPALARSTSFVARNGKGVRERLLLQQRFVNPALGMNKLCGYAASSNKSNTGPCIHANRLPRVVSTAHARHAPKPQAIGGATMACAKPLTVVSRASAMSALSEI